MEHNQTVKCRTCGADIIFIETEAGRKMPCNARPVKYQLNDKGKQTIVTTAGKVIKASIIENPNGTPAPVIDGTGYTPHWSTCPNAKDFRRRK